jgi:hypothetical protein
MIISFSIPSSFTLITILTMLLTVASSLYMGIIMESSIGKPFYFKAGFIMGKWLIKNI